jgi:hypothetical protein
MIMTVPGDHLGSCSKRPLGQDVVPEAPKHEAKSSVIVGGIDAGCASAYTPAT